MTGRRSQLFTLALLVSLCLHLGTYLWFSIGPARRHNSVQGVVSVDYIQSIAHEVPPSAPAVRRKGKEAAPRLDPIPAATSTSPNETPATGASAAADPAVVASETSRFITSLSHLLNQKKVYPKTSIDREEEGRVMIGLTLDRAGALLDSAIEEASPFARLNEAALQTVRNVGQFPPVPDAVPAPIHLHVPILFQIRHN